jgi:hypothetical protein
MIGLTYVQVGFVGLTAVGHLSWDQCYDFRNRFAEKFGDPKYVQPLMYKVCNDQKLVFKKSAAFFTKIGENGPKW